MWGLETSNHFGHKSCSLSYDYDIDWFSLSSLMIWIDSRCQFSALFKKEGRWAKSIRLERAKLRASVYVTLGAFFPFLAVTVAVLFVGKRLLITRTASENREKHYSCTGWDRLKKLWIGLQFWFSQGSSVGRELNTIGSERRERPIRRIGGN